MKAFHFLAENSIMSDGSKAPKDGEWFHYYHEPVIICQSGLHFSREPFDALKNAPGPICCLVEVEDIVTEWPDKGVCHQRMIISRIDATEQLRYFARMQALSVIHLLKECPPDPVLDYLMTGEEKLRAGILCTNWPELAQSLTSANDSSSWYAKRAITSSSYSADTAAWHAAYFASRAVTWELAINKVFNFDGMDKIQDEQQEEKRSEFNALIYNEFEKYRSN